MGQQAALPRHLLSPSHPPCTHPPRTHLRQSIVRRRAPAIVPAGLEQRFVRLALAPCPLPPQRQPQKVEGLAVRWVWVAGGEAAHRGAQVRLCRAPLAAAQVPGAQRGVAAGIAGVSG